MLDFLLYLGFFALGIVVEWKINFIGLIREVISKKENEETETTSASEPKVNPNHIPPAYWAYKPGFNSITICVGCGRTGLYENQHPASPCRKCGDRVKENVGRWTGTHWELRK